MAKNPPKCDICGEPMFAFYGCGFDNDFMICGSREWRGDYCGAEIVFPTSTLPPEDDALDVPKPSIKCPCCGNTEKVEKTGPKDGEIYACRACWCVWDEEKRNPTTTSSV